MSNRFNYVLVGLVNQPQIDIRHKVMPNFINYLLLGVINQPQFRLEQKGENMEDDELTSDGEKEKDVQVRVQGGSGGAVYGLGLIGACIYFINRGVTPQDKLVGFLKALVWPVFLVKGAFEFLEKEQ
jgi:hypothetical protein